MIFSSKDAIIRDFLIGVITLRTVTAVLFKGRAALGMEIDMFFYSSLAKYGWVAERAGAGDGRLLWYGTNKSYVQISKLCAVLRRLG